MTKNSRPRSPSRVRVLPSSTSRSSVALASSPSSCLESAAKSGAFASASTFVSCGKSTRGIYISPGASPTPAARARVAAARWLCARFHSFPSSATVRLSPVGNEHGVVAESFGALLLGRDLAFERARAAELLAIRREDDELGHVAGAAVFALGPGERLQELRDVLLVVRRLRPRSGPSGSRVLRRASRPRGPSPRRSSSGRARRSGRSEPSPLRSRRRSRRSPLASRRRRAARSASRAGARGARGACPRSATRRPRYSSQRTARTSSSLDRCSTPRGRRPRPGGRPRGGAPGPHRPPPRAGSAPPSRAASRGSRAPERAAGRDAGRLRGRPAARRRATT